MTIREIAALQKCSERQARRYCVVGLRGKVLKSTMDGYTRLIATEDYKRWRADCGFSPLPESEPQKAPVGFDLRADLPTDPVALPEKQAMPSPEDLDGWSTNELEAARRLWMQPDCLSGIPTNQPAVGSSNMPNPTNFALLIRANAILGERYALAQPRTVRRPVGRFQLRQTY